MTFRNLISTAIMLTCAGPAFAINLQEIYELALENDPQLAAAESTYLAGREAIVQSRSALLPDVSFNASRTKTTQTIVNAAIPGLDGKSTSDQWQAVLRQPVFRAEAWFGFQRAKNIEAQALAQFEAAQQAMIVRVAQTYFNILEAQDRLSASMAERDAVQRQLEQVQQRFDVGLVAITDVLESTAAYDSSTVNVIEAEGAQVISFESLLRLTGQSYKSVAALEEAFPVEYPEPRDEEAWVNAAIAQNLSLRASREAVRAAERQVQVGWSGHMPTVDAQATYTHNESSQRGVFGSQNDNEAVSLSLNVPIYKGGRTSSILRQYRHQLDAAQLNFDLEQRQVVEQTRSLYSAINTDVARVRARLRGIESSQSALDATETGYEVGTRNIVDVLLAQQRLFAAQFQYASARYRYINDTLQLKQLVGSLSPQDIMDLNRFISADQNVEQITPTTR